jgi:hypothetical protein
MKYSLDFPEHVQIVAKHYVEVYNNNRDIRDNHKANMTVLDQIGKEVKVFKEIASCIDTLLWMNDQPEEL